MSKRGHRPQRTCLGCGARDDQRKLIRLVVTDRADLQIDDRGGGRGGYLHREPECWQNLMRRKSLHRAFRVALNKDAKIKLIQRLKERNWES
jgi:uncharacterized protein